MTILIKYELILGFLIVLFVFMIIFKNKIYTKKMHEVMIRVHDYIRYDLKLPVWYDDNKNLHAKTTISGWMFVFDYSFDYGLYKVNAYRSRYERVPVIHLESPDYKELMKVVMKIPEIYA